MSNFHDRLREERERLGMTQAALGELGGIKKGTQHAYENGSRVPDADYLGRIAVGGVDVSYVVLGSYAGQPSLTKVEQFILDTYRRFDVYTKDGINILFERLATVPFSGDTYPKWRPKPD